MRFINPRRLTRLATVGLLLVSASCKDFYDVNVDPLNPISATNAQLLPGTQVAMATYLGFSLQGLGQATSTLVGQLSSTRSVGSYQQDGDSFVNQWGGLYTDMLNNNEQIIRQATATNDWGYLGIAQIQKAYVYSIIVDMWGDVPYSEALQGVGNRAPRYDKGADIYNGNPALGIKGLFTLLDEGIANVSKGKALEPGTDIIYKGNLTSWARLGRSLKLKLYNQIRKTGDFSAQVNTLLNPNPAPMASILLTPTEDFEVDYGSSTAPENRHIGFLSDYVSPSRENTIGRYFYEETMNGDPRRRYYFYNQLKLGVNTGSVDYPAGSTTTNFVTVRLGSTGQNAAGNTSDIRTLPGLYPVGGRYDPVDAGGTATAASGTGLAPQRLYPYYASKFTEAELRLMEIDDAAGAATALRAAVDASFAKVNEIAVANSAPPISATVVGAYAGNVIARFNMAANKEAKLAIIMMEKYKAGFGTGPDLYTDFRRTHYPAIKIPNVAPADAPTLNALGLLDDNDPDTQLTGPYPRRLLYRLNDLLTNPNAPQTQPPVTSPVFWDVP